MKWPVVIVLVLLLLAVAPLTASAQSPTAAERDDVLIRVNAPVRVAAGEVAGTVVVIGDDAVIEGTVDNLFVIDGAARISGTVNHNVTVVSGTVTLLAGARVQEDVLLYRSDAIEQPGATVVGGVHEEWGGFNVGRGFWLGVWLSMTVAVVAAGLLFAAFGGRQLGSAATAFTGRAGQTVLAAVIVWVVVPFVAVLAMITVIGIPLGIGVLVFLLPALWFLGYLVAGAALGSLIVRAARGAAHSEHPYVAVLVGLFILQAIVLIPFFGAMVALVAGVVGAGAIVERAWTAWRGAGTPRPLATPMGPAAPTT